MKNTSFGKRNDVPIEKKNADDFNDEDLDLDDDNDLENKVQENKKTVEKKEENEPKKEKEEIEKNTDGQKNEKIMFSSESEDNNSDSDKSSSEKENNKNKEKSIEEEKQKKEEKNENENKINDQNEQKEENEKKEKNEKNEKNDLNGSFEKKLTKDREIEDILINSIKNKENATSQRIQLAEEINFKAIPDKIIQTDQYGFLIDNKNNNQDSNEDKSGINERTKSGAELLQINARMEKWNYMIEHYEEFVKKDFNKLKSRTRKGVPDSLRSYIWQLFGEKDKFYEKDLFTKLESIPMNEDTELVIIKDLDRTFPACQLFKDKYGNGQRKLYKILSYYSKYNTGTGYVQGMGFIVAVFLTYMDEESSFFMLHSLMKKYNMEGFYLPGFPILKKTFYILLNLEKKFIPKVYELFKKEGMIPSMYASEWFICLFSRNLEFKSLVRIFDVFLLEGFKVIYRFALAFIKLKEDKFLEGAKDGLASIMPIINECTENVDVDKMFKVAFGFSISRKYIDKLGKEYEEVKDDQKNEFVQQL